MRVDFVGHATLLVRQGPLSVLSDPWWTSPAYRGQWYPYPSPVPERYPLDAIDALYLSHLHDDHLHRETLRELVAIAPHAAAIIPRRYDTGLRDYLRRTGVARVQEVASGSSYVLRKGGEQIRLTLFTNLDDSLVILEAGGEVLINANDALHSSPSDLIEEYCRIIRQRFPRIDYLFCGFGGASYFPNCLRIPGKDDVAVARAREELFLHNFSLIAERLTPRVALPFAAHFVLPDERNWWISALRLSMPPPAAIVQRFLPGSSIQVVDLQPGDYIEEGTIHASPYPQLDDAAAVRADVLGRFPASAPVATLADEQFSVLAQAVQARLSAAAPRLPREERVHAVLALWDYPPQVLNLRVGGGLAEVAVVPRAQAASLEPDVVLETRSDLVRSTMETPFGRDLICVGYGGLVHLRTRELMARAPHETLLSLLAPPQPRWRQRLRQHPLRTLAFALRDPGLRRQLKRKLRRATAEQPPRRETGLYDLGDWAS